MKQGGRVNPRSDKRIEMRYGEFVAAQLATDNRCHVGPIIATIDPLWTGCRRRATGLHHLRKRSSAGAITCEANTLRSCDPCNGWVEDHPRLARLAELVLRSDSPRWAELGARHHQDHHEGTT